MYVYMYMYVYIYMYGSIYMCIYIYICMYIYVCIYICMYVCAYIYVCIYMCMYIYMYVYIYIFACIYMYVYIYMYVCIYMRVCIYVYIYVCICICMYVYICMYVCMYICMYIYTYMYVCIYMYVYIYMYLFMYIYMYVCRYIYVYICICVYIYACIYICIHVYIYICIYVLLYGCTTWTLTKRLEKKLDGNYTRMLRAILNKSWQQHPTRHQLYGHLPPITKTIQVRRTRHAGHCWRSRDELIRDVLLWIPTHGRAKAGRPARTYIQQLCEDTGCCPEDLPRAMNDREEWRERVRDIRAASTIWWWWWWCIYIYIYIFISLNIIDIFCLHIFLLILSNCRIDLIIFGGDWLIKINTAIRKDQQKICWQEMSIMFN